MNETEQPTNNPNDGNPEYLEHHPDAIQDIARAQVMAEASKESEEAVVLFGDKAIKWAGLAVPSHENEEKRWTGHQDYEDVDRLVPRRALEPGMTQYEKAAYIRDDQLSDAMEARREADARAQSASGAYDESLRAIAGAQDESEKIKEQVQRLKSGKSIEPPVGTEL